MGFILRVSEENGYESPWQVMTHAGILQGQMNTGGFPIDRLAAILGRDISELAKIAYSNYLPSGKREFCLLGQTLGQSLTYAPLRLKEPSFCAKCASEKGGLDAFWDLSFAVACPDHRNTLISKCPSCGIGLKWFRPGILFCKCGASLADAPVESINDELAELMTIVKAKVHGISLEGIANLSGYPLQQLENVPLRTLLILIEELGTQNLISHGKEVGEILAVAQSAGDVFRDWPNGFYDFLRRLSEISKLSGQDTVGLRKRFEKLYESLFKRRYIRQGIDFIRDEFVRFGTNEWGEGVVDNKLFRGERSHKRFVSTSEMSKRLGVRPDTLRAWVEKNDFPAETQTFGNYKRHIVDSNAITIKNGKAGKTLGGREAAAFIGIPVSVLKLLRETGHYRAEYLPSRRKAYHEIDLMNFKEATLSLTTRLPEGSSSGISLREVMRLKFRNETAKADFLRAVLDGRIQSIGRLGEGVDGLQFNTTCVEQFLRDKRAEAEEDSWSLSDTAQFLSCDPVIVPTLIREGFLQVSNCSTGRRVTIQSVKHFDDLYISVARLAKDAGTSSRKLQSKLEVAGVPLRLFERGYGKVGQPFIERKDQVRLNKIVA
jgi:DNA-binding transcriptional MerR regulator